MACAPSPFSAIQALADRWSVLALYLIACMRAVRVLEDVKSGRAMKQAEALEAGLHTAFHEITKDIARAEALAPDAQDRKDADAKQHLRLTRQLIAAMIMILQHIKLRLVINHVSPAWPVMRAATRRAASPAHCIRSDRPP